MHHAARRKQFGSITLAGALAAAATAVLALVPVDALAPVGLAMPFSLVISYVLWQQREHARNDLAALLRLAVPSPYEDPDTGLGTRRLLEIASAKEAARHRRSNEPFALALLSITDAFRPRRPVEPAIARAVAVILLRAARTEDSVCRLGERTFAVLLPCANATGAMSFLDRARIRVSSEPQREGDKHRYLTVYGGVGEWQDSMSSLEDLLASARADMTDFRVEWEHDAAEWIPHLP